MDAVGPDEHRDEASALHRREFLRRAGLIAGAAVVGPGLTRTVASQLTAGGTRAGRAPRITPESVFDAPAAEAPFDTVVVVMMENRSFDHFLGWLGTDAAYLDAGRARYGSGFHIDGRQDLTYTTPSGDDVATHWLGDPAAQQYPYEGCGEGIPGHGWDAGHAQLAAGSSVAGRATATARSRSATTAHPTWACSTP